MPNSKLDQLAATIQALQESGLTRDAVEQSFNLKLEHDAEQSTAAFHVLKAGESKSLIDIDSMEARISFSSKNEQIKLLIIEIPGGQMDESDIVQHYGSPDSIQPKPVRAPDDYPEYFAYMQKNYKLSFGFDRTAKDTVSTIVLEDLGK